jgi:hypothetical protein
LTPARETSIRTSSSSGSGTGNSVSSSTSGPPNSRIWIARTDARLASAIAAALARHLLATVL